MNVTGLHFLLTYQCTHQCSHCFLFGTPRAGGTFSIEQICHLLDEGKRLGTVKEAFFEGGEPFLHYPILQAAIREAHRHKLLVGVVTNAYWATSEKDALLWLHPLKEAGLANLTVSDDPLHENHEHAANALAAAAHLGIAAGAIAIETGTCESAPGEPVSGGNVMHRGRAAQVLAKRHAAREWTEFDRCEHERLEAPGRLHLDAGGFVHLCHGIAMGNWQKSPLSELIRKYDPASHPIVAPLLAGGPAALAREFGLPSGERYADGCHLCYQVRRSIRRRFPELLGPGQMYGDIGVMA